MKDVYRLEDLRSWKAGRPAEAAQIRLGILGDPVAHSLSPQIQNAALENCGLAMRYARFEVAPNELSEALALLPGLGFVGINLTAPHKLAAAGLVDELDDFARRVGAINTVRINDGKLLGCNTDGPGFALAIRSEFSVDLRGLRVLLLGAGGAARAIALQCATEGCTRLVLANRTIEKAQQLAAELKAAFGVLDVIPLEERDRRSAVAEVDLIVNATSLGMRPSDPSPIPAVVLTRNSMVYDTIYPGRTALLHEATGAGARTANGLSMLLHQGALAFEKWFDREAPVAVMRAALP